MADELEAAGRGVWSEGAGLVENKKKNGGTYEDRLAFMKKNIQLWHDGQRRVAKQQQSHDEELAALWEQRRAEKHEQTRQDVRQRLALLKKAQQQPQTHRATAAHPFSAGNGSGFATVSSTSGTGAGFGAALLTPSSKGGGNASNGIDVTPEREAAAASALDSKVVAEVSVKPMVVIDAGELPAEELEGDADDAQQVTAGDGDGEEVASPMDASQTTASMYERRTTRHRRTQKVESDPRDTLPSGQKLAFHSLMTALTQAKDEALRKAIAGQVAAPPSRGGPRPRGKGKSKASSGAAEDGGGAAAEEAGEEGEEEEEDPEARARRLVMLGKERSYTRRHRLRRMQHVAQEVLSCRTEFLRALTDGEYLQQSIPQRAPTTARRRSEEEPSIYLRKPPPSFSDSSAAAAAARLLAIGSGGSRDGGGGGGSDGGSLYWSSHGGEDPWRPGRPGSKANQFSGLLSAGATSHAPSTAGSLPACLRQGFVATAEEMTIEPSLRPRSPRMFVQPRLVGEKIPPPLQVTQGWAPRSY